ncbi:MAG: protein kinase [Gammaproteobacteria bacterium]|nr:protein kinase [Gammaproteobacteria bacterium]
MKISGYKIESRIGAGGQAMVYLAIQESLQRPVALKVLNPLYADSPEFTTRFLNEGRILANLGHSNVITIHDIGVEDGFHYLSMELVEGGDLKQRMPDGIEPVTALIYVRTIADCLATAHAKNIVHRDIKPANVLFRKDGTLLLTDFGIAKRLDGQSDLTLTGTTVGSPHYLSPEQAQGKKLDGRADVYSLGIMAYEMLVGRKPFVGDSDIDTIFKHINEPVPALPPHLAAYQELIDRMTAKLPEDRFESASAVVSYIEDMDVSGPAPVDLALGEVSEPAGTRTRIAGIVGDQDAVATEVALDRMDDDSETEVNLKTAPAEPRAHRFAFPLIIAGCVLGGAALAWLFLGRAPEPPEDVAAGRSGVDTVSPESSTASAGSATVEQARVDASPPASPPAPADTRPAKQEAAAASTTPAPPSLVSDAETRTRVASLLDQAEKALEDFRLTRPAGNNALEYYNEVLALEPANPVAADANRRIANRYGVLAQGEVRRGNYVKAGEFADRGLELDPGNADLLALKSEVDTAIAEGRSGGRAGSEIKGESPKELYERIKGWFK